MNALRNGAIREGGAMTSIEHFRYLQKGVHQMLFKMYIQLH